METITLDGLYDADVLAAAGPAVANLPVEVVGVVVGQAPALLELMLKQQTSDLWDLYDPSLRRLRYVARIANEATAVVDAVVPMLGTNLLNDGAGALLRRYGWSLRHLARRVDGPGRPFHAIAVELSSFILGWADERRKVDHDALWLAANLEEIRVRMGALRTHFVVFTADDNSEEDAEDSEGA